MTFVLQKDSLDTKYTMHELFALFIALTATKTNRKTHT